MAKNLIIFDADGTLRRCTVHGRPTPHGPGEWQVLPGVQERLSLVDWRRTHFGIASNQYGVKLGFLSRATALDLLRRLGDVLVPNYLVEALRICTHAPDDGCLCRKPRPGMLFDIMRVCRVGPDETLYVGDLETDQQAARGAGVEFAWAWEYFGKSQREWVDMLERLNGRCDDHACCR